ncbi:MAG: Rne/Rng family ribonuclease [bacterium]
MPNELVINVTPYETRAALIENGVVTELYTERGHKTGHVGNMYKGRVLRVLPGMQAAFVDIGLDRASFLYVTDVHQDELADYSFFLTEENEEILEEPLEESEEAEEVYDQVVSPNTPPTHEVHIEDLLKEGQEILVQVVKDPLGTKGPRVTMHASLPGRYLVFMPTVNHIGISRRIEDEKERQRLKKIIQKIKPPFSGFIIRTVSMGRSEKELKADMDYLMKLWEEIQSRKDQVAAPALLHQDLNLTLRLIRDIFTPDVTRLVIDCHEEHDKVCAFIETFMPKLRNQVTLYEQSEPIFDAYRIEVQISEALDRKVWLKSGGYIVIDETEALTAIDVNTGKYVGQRNLDDTILKTNLEAVKEIVYQLRLRNIGGIIIIDFIDMEKKDHRDKVFHALVEAVKADRARTNILKISDLGVVEMTRKRTRESIVRTLCEPCPYCEGKGHVKSRQTICYEIFRQLQREKNDLRGKKIVLNLHPDIANLLYAQEHANLERLEKECGKAIQLKTRSDFHVEQFEITSY